MSLARLPYFFDRFFPALFLVLGMAISAAFAVAVGV